LLWIRYLSQQPVPCRHEQQRNFLLVDMYTLGPKRTQWNYGCSRRRFMPTHQKYAAVSGSVRLWITIRDDSLENVFPCNGQRGGRGHCKFTYVMIRYYSRWSLFFSVVCSCYYTSIIGEVFNVA